MTRRQLLILPAAAALARAAQPQLIDVKRIWDRGHHNAFTDLIRFKGKFYCVFREAQSHVSNDGAIRVLASKDMKSWTSAALVKHADGDLRDPKISITPGGRLMLATALAPRAKGPVKHHSMVHTSSNGSAWSEPTIIGDPNVWLWRVCWRGKREALSVGYGTGDERFIRLYRTTDGLKYETVAPKLLPDGYPNESSILFDADGTAHCLLRRDEADKEGMFGVSKPPYKEWAWRKLGARIGGPHMIRLADGRLLAAVRLYDGKTRTSLCWIHDKGIEEFLPLPSKGDSSYPGLVIHKDHLYVSYYSSHEGKTSIYLATVRLG